LGLTAGTQTKAFVKEAEHCNSSAIHLFPRGSWTGLGVVNATTGIFDPTGLIPGNYQVGYVYQDTSGACKDTAYKRVTIFDSIHVALPPPVLCVNQSFNFGTITGNIINANWNFGDGTPDAIIINPSHTYSSPGNYIVTLIAETPDRCKRHS
jgi:PKD repeat protein